MILPIYTYGQPVLREVAQDITPDYPKLKELTANMFETLTDADGVGLAAPQIGLAIRLVIIDLDVMKDENPKYKDFRKVYINPHILEFGEEQVSMEEGCLSLPGIHENVKRSTKIKVQYLDENFEAHEEVAEDYLARVMQHEFDHLDGHVFVERISPLRKQIVKNKLNTMLNGRVHCSYRVKVFKRR
jgi:peptide deformylase